MAADGSFLGIDTSCYTTSIAVAAGGEAVQDHRIMLEVPQGGRGLRQSEAVFRHIRNLKQLFADYQPDADIRAVGYSAKPCPKPDSYMPVFAAGEMAAVAVAAALGVPAFASTHQHGHIWAAFFGKDIGPGEYCAFHVSGGTLELLKVRIGTSVEAIETIGGTRDITLGQLIDRVGVAAGLQFPAGAEMEEGYRPGGEPLSVNVDGLFCNLSGAETQAMRRLAGGAPKAAVFGSVIDCAGKTLAQLMENAVGLAGAGGFIFTGGVMRNGIIRQALRQKAEAMDAQAIFAQPRYCSDNACGLALMAQAEWGKGESD